MPICPRIKFHVNLRRWLTGLVCLSLLGSTLACVQTPAFLLTPNSGQGWGNPQDGTPQVVGGPGVTVIPGQGEKTPVQATPVPVPVGTPRPPILYYAQSGDWLPAVATRFGVSPEDITSPDSLPAAELIPPGQLLIIPDVLGEVGPSEPLLPDSEIVYSPSTVGFDIRQFVNKAGGYLASYREYVDSDTNTGAEIIDQVAMENSFNPRLLLALLEYQGGWVYGQPDSPAETDYPLGHIELSRWGLYQQLTWAARQLTQGYYGWRSGQVVNVTFEDGSTLRMAPGVNAGTAALQVFFGQLYPAERWSGTLYDADSFIALYARMFGDAWQRDSEVAPLFPPYTQQPELALPFAEGETWSFTGGPHPAWGVESVTGALDFAPGASAAGCHQVSDWVTAPAAGLVVRTGPGIVMLDLDGDGREQTGWVLLLLHIATWGKVQKGQFVDKGDRIGHPSCEGGRATGNHVHIARKFNGEWIPVEGPLPFVLSGYTAHSGGAAYEGRLTKDGVVIEANITGNYRSLIMRPPDP